MKIKEFKCKYCSAIRESEQTLREHILIIHPKKFEAIKMDLDRTKDLQKYDLIKLIIEANYRGEFGDDTEVISNIISLIHGIVSNNIGKIRKHMAALRAEKIFSRMNFHRLERFEGSSRKGFGDGI